MIKKPSWCLCAALVLLGPQVAIADEQERCPADSERVARVDVTVEEEQIVASPESVTIYLDNDPKRLCWVVSGLEAQHTLHIEKKADQEDLFPQAERRIISPSTFANSGLPAKTGTWRYKLSVTVSGQDTPLLELDPEVIIDKGKTAEIGN